MTHPKPQDRICASCGQQSAHLRVLTLWLEVYFCFSCNYDTFVRLLPLLTLSSAVGHPGPGGVNLRPVQPASTYG